MAYNVLYITVILFLSNICFYPTLLQMLPLNMYIGENKFLNINNILDRYFIHENHQLFIVINTSSEADDLFSCINQEDYIYSIVMFRFIETFQKRQSMLEQPYYNILIFLDTFENIEHAFNKTQNKILWEYNSRFIFIINKNLVEEIDHQLEEKFKPLRRQNIFQGLILFWTCSNPTHRSIATQCLKVFVFSFSYCFEEIIYIRDISNNWFAFDNFNSFTSYKKNNCKYLRISLYHDPGRALPVMKDGRAISYEGYDGYTMQTIAEYLHMTPIWLTLNTHVTSGFRQENGTLTGTSGEVAYGRADIAANSRYIKEWPEVKFTYPHDTDSLFIVVPKSKRVPQYKQLFLPFTSSLWGALLVTLLLASLIWYHIKKYMFYIVGIQNRNVTMENAFIDLFRSFITGTTNMTPTTTVERLFFIIVVFFGIIMTSAFQGSLTSFLSVPIYHKDINTLKEVKNSKFRLFVYKSIKSIVHFDPSDETMMPLWKKFLFVDNFTHMLEYLGKYDDMGCTMNEYSVRLIFRLKNYMKDGHPLLHKVRENILTSYNVYEVPRNSPYLDEISTAVKRLTEGGFQPKWYRDTIHKYILNGYLSEHFNILNARTTPLLLKHMQTAFYILFIGLFHSFLVFLAELLIKIRKKNH
ncbi:hypothetical protein L9F63_008596 [Diploptera punctata]|uniref:Ionotropic glutamate receptor C-terminal domain-containing protein n=1 Tax=Diploptera punctata TaxID=6984 RepID=A0AAD7Z4Z8_DIPPU|nr:hypothetical protein L9F63_008596 [Diploptera punctata]